jgi:hypothetical protein
MVYVAITAVTITIVFVILLTWGTTIHPTNALIITSLSDLPTLRQSHFISPYANWVIPGKLIQGRNPGSGRGHSLERMRVLRQDFGVTTFVCLQAEVPPQSPDTLVFGEELSAGEATCNIMPGFVNYAMEANQFYPDTPANFIYMGIRDFQPADSMDDLVQLTGELKRRMEEKEDEVLYLHCWGGKGRAGLVAACMLGCMYNGMGAEEALERIQTYANVRNPATPINSPETEEQKDQVRLFFKQYLKR